MLYKFLHPLYNAYEKKCFFFQFLTVLVSLHRYPARSLAIDLYTRVSLRVLCCCRFLFIFFSLLLLLIVIAAMSKPNFHTDAIRFVDRAFTQHHICTVLRKIKNCVRLKYKIVNIHGHLYAHTQTGRERERDMALKLLVFGSNFSIQNIWTIFGRVSFCLHTFMSCLHALAMEKKVWNEP